MTTIHKKKELVDNLIKGEVVKTVLALIRKEQPVTMDEIARQCGVAKGTLYNYFKDKKALFKYVHQTIIDPIKETNNSIFESDKDPLVKLHEFIDAVFDTDEDISLYFHFVQQKRTVANQNNERFEVFIYPLVKFCKKGIQAGFFIDVDPYVLAEMIYGAVIGSLISRQFRSDGTPDRQQIKQDILYLMNKIEQKQ